MEMEFENRNGIWNMNTKVEMVTDLANTPPDNKMDYDMDGFFGYDHGNEYGAFYCY